MAELAGAGHRHLDTLREQLRAQISWQRWIRGRYRLAPAHRRRPDRQAVAADRAPRPDQAAVPGQRDLHRRQPGRRHGRRPCDGARQLVAQMQQGAPFAAVARQFSSAATAANGGDAGWVSPGELPPELRAGRSSSCRPASSPSRSRCTDGVYIVCLRDKRAGGGRPLVILKQAAVAPAAPTPPSRRSPRPHAKLDGAARAQGRPAPTSRPRPPRSPGVVAGDLGEADVNDLAPAFRDAAETLHRRPGVSSRSAPRRACTC